MATIAIRGIRITSFSADKVLAKQAVGGYQGLEMTPSPATIKALENFKTLFKNDVNMILGLDVEA